MLPPGQGLQDTGHLQSNELFEGLEPGELASVAQAGRPRRFKAGAYIFRQGAPATNLYVLLSGQVKVMQVTPDGEQVILRLVSPGELFGATATLGDAVYPAGAQAVDDCRLLTWDADSILGLMRQFPELAINALRIVARRVQEFQDRYRELATERVERRVARALLRLASQMGRRAEGGILVEPALTRQDLAEMTGTTRYTISRILSEWEQQGLVEASRERVLIKRPHGLVVIAEDLPPTSPLNAP